MTAKVVVTDNTFPDLDREDAASNDAEAAFESHQCRTEDEVVEGVNGVVVAVVKFASFGARAIAALAPGAVTIRYGAGYDNINVAAANAAGHPVGSVPDYGQADVATAANVRFLPFGQFC